MKEENIYKAMAYIELKDKHPTIEQIKTRANEIKKEQKKRLDERIKEHCPWIF